jgi:hypothetical protein
MRADDFRALLRARRFEPFIVHLTTGASFEVRDPKLAVVGRSIVWLQLGLPDHLVPVAVRRIAISLVHIVWIEFPEDAQRHRQN